MGARSAQIGMSMAPLIMLLTVFTLAVPLQRLNFRALLGLADLSTVDIYTVWAASDLEGLCHWGFPLWRRCPSRDWFCRNPRTHDLQQIAERMCSPLARVFFPGMCDGMQAAFLLGMVLFAALVINAFILQPFAAFMLYDYAARKPSRRTRSTATMLIMVGLMSVLFSALLYVFFVLFQLEHNSWGTMFVGESPGLNVYYGTFLAFFIAVAQGIQLLVCATIRGTDERILDSMKERDYDSDYEGDYGYGYGGGGGYGATGHHPGYGGASSAAGGVLQVTDITIQPVQQRGPPPQQYGFGPPAW